jgi:hypothetical protein
MNRSGGWLSVNFRHFPITIDGVNHFHPASATLSQHELS